MPLWMLCLNPWVIDGDSVRCDNLGEIRLLGVDTPDYRDSPPCAGHYGNHVCNDAAAKAAKRALVALKMRERGERWTVRGYGRDRYGRLLADVRIGSISVQCYELKLGMARYIPAYDQQQVIARECLTAAAS